MRSTNNRIICSVDEDLPSPMGSPLDSSWCRRGRVWPTSRAPTSLYADPIVLCDVQFILMPLTAQRGPLRANGTVFGYFTSKEKWPLDQPGVWTYTVNATWNGFKGRVPGLPDQVGTSSFWRTVSQSGPGMTLNLSRAAVPSRRQTT